MEQLSTALESLSGQEIKDKQLILDVVANLKTSRYLRLLQAIDMASPGAALRLLPCRASR